MICQVETYSGSRLHERPRRFTWMGAWLEVAAVRAQWRGPEELHFELVAADGGVFRLTYHFLRDEWRVARK